ncbi:uncharacterized protein LOC132165053 [Corylus avellana]|uniref:uncharacterized protein LOC132165053 n=1 Tax=Corylus avellana TaxID=13451 RepID=UPI00286BFE49|nr:uncharacterized protein LOC132165053 [Corylus avellana]
MLLIPNKDNNKKVGSLYSITNLKISNVNLPIHYNKRCCGSSFDWLSFVTKSSFVILFNPIRNEKINLSQLERHRGYRRNVKQCTVKKLKLSPDPSEDSDWLVEGIFGEYSDLVFMKLGDESWTYHVHGELFSNVLYYKGQVLAIDHRSELISLDRQGMTGYFKVHKLVLDDESGRLVEREEVKNIGDDALYVGDNQSISISTSDFLDCWPNGPNSIYYTDDYITAYEYNPNVLIDMSIFNLEDGSTRLHYKPIPTHKNLPPPI